MTNAQLLAYINDFRKARPSAGTLSVKQLVTFSVECKECAKPKLRRQLRSLAAENAIRYARGIISFTTAPPTTKPAATSVPMSKLPYKVLKASKKQAKPKPSLVKINGDRWKVTVERDIGIHEVYVNRVLRKGYACYKVPGCKEHATTINGAVDLYLQNCC